MVTVVEITRELWLFNCPRCGDSWTVDHERRAHLGHGGTGLEHGPVEVAAAPLCRACGYIFVGGRRLPAVG